MRPAVSRFGVRLLGACVGLACQAPVPTGASVPSIENGTPPDPCSAPAGAAAVDADLLPVTLPGFCLDPYAAPRSYGVGAPDSLERACARVLGPGCAEGYGLDRVVTLRYLSRVEPGASVDAVLSHFDTTAGASAYLTDTLIGDLDPESLDVSLLDGPGLTVQRAEDVLAWRGRHVLSLRRSDEQHSEQRALADAARELPGLARTLVSPLPDAEGVPAPLERLPQLGRVRLGARLILDDALGIAGVGLSARGYYREGNKRWRVLSIVRPDAESARDVLGTLGRHPSAKKIKGLEAIEFTERRLPAEPQLDWVFGQRGDVIYGIGDEATALPELMPARDEAKVKLSLSEKLGKLSRIHQE